LGQLGRYPWKEIQFRPGLIGAKIISIKIQDSLPLDCYVNHVNLATRHVAALGNADR
jgi:hypothetical protein